MVLDINQDEDDLFPARQGEEGQSVEYIGGDLKPAGMEFVWNGFMEFLRDGDFTRGYSPLIGVMTDIISTDGVSLDSGGTVYFKMPFECRLKQFKVIVPKNTEDSATDLVIMGISSYNADGEAIGIAGNEYGRITIPALTTGTFTDDNDDSSLTIAAGEAVILVQEPSGSTIAANAIMNLSISLRFKEVVA